MVSNLKYGQERREDDGEKRQELGLSSACMVEFWVIEPVKEKGKECLGKMRTDLGLLSSRKM